MDFYEILKDDQETHILPLRQSAVTPLYTFLVFDICDTDLFDLITTSNDLDRVESSSSGDLNNQYADRGDEDEFKIPRKSDAPLSFPAINSVLTQLFIALEHCHQRGVSHGDLKPENVLVTFRNSSIGREKSIDDAREVSVYLTDFGLSTTERQSQDFRTGSTRYLSPDALGCGDKDSYNTRSNDVWALGIIICNLFTGGMPWTTAHSESYSYAKFLSDPNFFIKEFGLPIVVSSFLRGLFLATEKDREDIRVWRTKWERVYKELKIPDPILEVDSGYDSPTASIVSQPEVPASGKKPAAREDWADIWDDDYVDFSVLPVFE